LAIKKETISIMIKHKLLLVYFLSFFITSLLAQSENFPQGFFIEEVLFFSPEYNSNSSQGWIRIRKDNKEFYSNHELRITAFDNYGGTTRPVGYVSGNKSMVGCFINAEFCGSELEGPFYIKGVADNNMEYEPQEAVIQGNFLRYSRKQSDIEFPEDVVAFYDGFIIEWFVTQDPNALDPNLEANVNWESAGESENQLYVTHRDPIIPETPFPEHSDPTMVLHTLIHNACFWSQTKNSPQNIVDCMYADFTDRQVFTFDGQGPMTYWGGNNQIGTTEECRSVSGLLEFLDAACNEWAEYFDDQIKIQGIESSILSVVTYDNYILSDSDISKYVADGLNIFETQFFDLRLQISPFPNEITDSRTDFYVKEWNFNTNIPFVINEYKNAQNNNSIDNLTLINGNILESASLEGTEGQGNDNPRAEFSDHLILKYNNKYFDPSYGSPIALSKNNWENNSLDGFGTIVTFFDTQSNKEYYINWVGHLNNTGVLQCNITP